MLSALQRVRRLEQVLARRAMADAIAAERKAEAAVHEAQAALIAQASADPGYAMDPAQDCAAPCGSWAIWLPVGLAEVARSQFLHDQSQAALDAARDILGSARSASRAAQALIDVHRAAQRQAEGRKAQHRLDDAARPRSGPDRTR